MTRCWPETPMPDSGTRSGDPPGASVISSVAVFAIARSSVSGENDTNTEQVPPGGRLAEAHVAMMGENSLAFGPTIAPAPTFNVPVPVLVIFTITCREANTGVLPYAAGDGDATAAAVVAAAPREANVVS